MFISSKEWLECCFNLRISMWDFSSRFTTLVITLGLWVACSHFNPYLWLCFLSDLKMERGSGGGGGENEN
jgi:hypothetical protein